MGYQIFFTCGFITNLGIYNTSEWSCSNVSDIQRKHSHISHISCCCHWGMFSPHTKMILNLTRPSVCIGAIFLFVCELCEFLSKCFYSIKFSMSLQRVCPPRTLTVVGPPRDQGQEGGRDPSAPEVPGSTNIEIWMLQKLWWTWIINYWIQE